MIPTSPDTTKLLVHAAEAAGSTTPADSSPSAHTLAAAGNAQVSDDHACLGNNMLKFDGAGDYFALPYSSDFDFGSGAFTVDFWLWLPSAGFTGGLIAARSSSSSYCPLALSISTGKIWLLMSSGNSSWQVNTYGPTTVPVGELVHVALVRNAAGQTRVYLNGVVELTTTAVLTFSVLGQPWTIGAQATDIQYLNGYLGELRILKGEAAWTEPFTPPAEAYTVVGDETVVCPGFAGAASLAASPGLQVVCPGFSVEASLTATLFEGVVIEAPGFTGTAGLSGAAAQLLAGCQFTAVAALAADLEALAVLVTCPGFAAELTLAAAAALLDYANPALRYYCTLTGAADGQSDLLLPISSFQAQHRRAAASYLSVVVPGNANDAEIAARPNGALVLRMAKVFAGAVFHSEEILRVPLEQIRTDDGGRNRSATLSGYATLVYAAKEVTLQGVVYRAVHEGKTRLRLAFPDIFLRPGDTAVHGDDSFTVESISYSVGTRGTTCEVSA